MIPMLEIVGAVTLGALIAVMDYYLLNSYLWRKFDVSNGYDEKRR